LRLVAAATLVVFASFPVQARKGPDSEPSLDAPVCSGSSSLCQWELRPEVDEWFSLLEPIHEILVGTKRADALGAGAEGDIVRGLAGDDSLTSAFNRTALLGARGDDVLVTDTRAVGEGVHALAIQLGGEDDDWHRASLGVSGSEANGELLLDLGSGHDVVDANVYTDFSYGGDDDDNVRSIQIYGRGGDDVISAVADAQGVYQSSLAINAVDGGKGDDRITVRAVTEFFGGGTIADNRVNGGDGDDVVDATAINWPNSPISASNALSGGLGDDVMRAFCLTDSNEDYSIGFNGLWGGEGDDQLEAVHVTDGENWLTELTTVLEGEGGDDTLRADSTAYGENVLAVHRLAGGPGDDTLMAVFDLAVLSGYDGNESANVLEGGPGSDRLEASVTASFLEPCEAPYCELPRADNHLDGGGQSDVLFATVGPDVVGASFLLGGNGADQLTVVGGSGNVLDGGNGRDDLFGGAGDDRFIGGNGPDTFHFDLAENQGTDTVVDYEAGRDLLSFAGLNDEGVPGLADDLDAVSTITDLGPGDDVVIDLVVGTRIVFAGQGTGEIASWDALAPRHALAKWTPTEVEEARVAPARPLSAAASEFAGYSRDH
jgi:Ca2+-binding RTX toxin-like protein